MQDNPIKSKTAQAILAELKNPFPVNLLHYRVGARTKDKTKAVPLFYLTMRDIQKKLDEVVGPDGWSKETEVITSSSGLVTVKTQLAIRFPSGWVCKDGLGEPTKIAPSLGAESQSFKRAAVAFGISRYLYFINLGWREIDEYGNFKEDLRKALPKWAYPGEVANWEEVAQQEYDSEIDLEDLPEGFITDEETELLRKSEEVRKAILERAKES